MPDQFHHPVCHGSECLSSSWRGCSDQVADRLPQEGLAAPGSVDLLKLVQETQSPQLSTLGTVHPFVFADHVLLVLESMREQQEVICRQLSPLIELIELREPFLRIQEAIEEAHRTALGEPRHRQAG